MYDKQYRFYILEQGHTYLFIFHNFVKICDCQAFETHVIIHTTLLLICLLLEGLLDMPVSSHNMIVTHYVSLFQNVSPNPDA